MFLVQDYTRHYKIIFETGEFWDLKSELLDLGKNSVLIYIVSSMGKRPFEAKAKYVMERMLLDGLLGYFEIYKGKYKGKFVKRKNKLKK